MIEWMLAEIINKEFEKVVGKGQYDSRKAMHVGFRMNTGDSSDQYRICHLYIFAPCNYVHIAVQEERIDENNKRHVSPIKHLCYHDSCWRDSVQSFIFEHRDELGGFQSLLKLSDWYDVITLTESEQKYLQYLDRENHIRSFGTDNEKKDIAEKLKVNPFDERSVWNKNRRQNNDKK